MKVLSTPILTIALWYGISVTKCHLKNLNTSKKELSGSFKMTIILAATWSFRKFKHINNDNSRLRTRYRFCNGEIIYWHCFKIFKTLHQLIPRFMSNFFEVKSSRRPARSQKNLNLKVIRANQGLQIWRTKCWKPFCY